MFSGVFTNANLPKRLKKVDIVIKITKNEAMYYCINYGREYKGLSM